MAKNKNFESDFNAITKLNETQINKLKNIQDLVNNKFEKYNRPSEMVSYKKDKLLEADECIFFQKT